MRLRSIKLQNYRRYKSAELELPDGMISIVGSNGSGKSTLLEAFAWAMFGNQAEIVRTGKESVKRQGASPTDPCSVRIEFDYEDTQYTIERTMKGKNHTVNAEMHAGGSLMAKGTDEVSEALVKLFGMDHKSFFISVFARQTELNALTSQPKGDRKKMVIRLLDIESLDEAIRRIREDRSEAEESIETARSELNGPEGRPVTDSLATEIGSLSQTEKELVKRKAALESEMKKTESVMAKLKKELPALEKMAKEKNALESAIKSARRESALLDEQKRELAADLGHLSSKEEEFKALEAKAPKYAKDLSEILGKKKETQTEKESVRSEMSELKAGIRQLEKEIKEINIHIDEITEIGPDSDCPTCKRRLGETYESLLAEYSAQTDERKAKITAANSSFSELEDRLKDCDARAAALEKRESGLRDKISKFEKLKFEAEQVSKLRKKMTDLEGRAARAVAELQTLEKKNVSISFDEKAYEQSKKALDEINAELRTGDRNIMAINTELARAEERKTALSEKLDRLRQMEARFSEQRAKAELLTDLEQVMGDFRTHLISRIRPALMASSSELLGVLTEGRYNELILDEDYEISLRDQGEQHRLERFSGGEKDLANLCLRLAISEIIATRHGTNSFDLIVLDEIFGSQDANRKRTLLSTLNGLSNRFKQIFLITHVEDVKELMGNVILVSENPDGTSTASVVQ